MFRFRRCAIDRRRCCCCFTSLVSNTAHAYASFTGFSRPPLTIPRVQPSTPHTPKLVNAARLTEVWEMEKGIVAAWVPDALGYHLPLHTRETSSAEQMAAVDIVANQKAAKQTEDTLTQQTNEMLPTSHPHRASSSMSSGRGGGRAGPAAFYGPLPSFEVSPVFEWLGCLWQWRPLAVHAASGDRPPSRRNAALNAYGCGRIAGGGVGHDDDAEKVADNTGASAQSHPPHLYLVPFLLLPTVEVPSSSPHLHASLRDAVLTRHLCLCRTPSAFTKQYLPQQQQFQFMAASRASSSSASLWTLTTPTPVGELAVSVENAPAEPPLSVFAAMDRWRGGSTNTQHRQQHPQQRGATASSVTPLIPPAAETWESATDVARGGGNDTDTEKSVAASYVHVFRSDGACLDAAPSLPSAALTTPPASFAAVSPLRHNVMGGGVAELLLTIDRYAALMARGELTLSAACWATLCDTKSWWVVQRLRQAPMEVERELQAATAAHRRWQKRALTRNHTMVGKSSHGVQFDDYPELARWVAN